MKWLITVYADFDLEEFDSKLAAWECERIEERRPIPMGEDELSIEVIGPQDLPQRVADDDQITGIYPSSEMTLYSKDG